MPDLTANTASNLAPSAALVSALSQRSACESVSKAFAYVWLRSTSDSGKSAPAVAWSVSRKARNRRVHALNGNTDSPPLGSSQLRRFERALDDAMQEEPGLCASQAVEVAYARNAPLPTERLPLTIDHPEYMGPPHLGSNQPHICPVYPDGRCLYYCALALKDARAWMATHDGHGAALETPQGQREAQEAEAIRSLVRCRATAIGDETSSTRLGQDGPAGYPGLDDVGLIADVLGGSLVIQRGEVQVVKGDGPLIGHLHATVCADASVHESMHWEVLQSWYVHLNGDPLCDEEQQDTLPAAELENFPQADLDPLL